jgi:hypothetical protein
MTLKKGLMFCASEEGRERGVDLLIRMVFWKK